MSNIAVSDLHLFFTELFVRHDTSRKDTQTPCSSQTLSTEHPPEPALPGPVLCLWIMYHVGWHQHHTGRSLCLWHLHLYSQRPHYHRAPAFALSSGFLHSLLRVQQEAPDPRGAKRWEMGADADRNSSVWDGDEWEHAAGHYCRPAQPHQLPQLLQRWCCTTCLSGRSWWSCSHLLRWS